MENSEIQANASRPPRRWPLFILGVLLFFLGPALYVVQFRFGRLWMPWYLPGLATVGAALMIGSVWHRRGVFRSATLLLFLLLCGFEWYVFLIATKTPLYAGPVQLGRRLPAFSAALANGDPFTDEDLTKGVPTVLTFFRGRW